MRFKKGSKEAKAFMAKLRAKRATKSKVKPKPSRIDDLLLLDEIKARQKKVGAVSKNKGIRAKKAVKKVKAKKIGSTLKLTPKETRLGATEKDFKPKSKSYHKDTKSHNVNIKVVSGIDKIGTIDYLHKEIVTVSNLIDSYERAIKGNNEYLKIATDYDKKKVRQQTAYYRQKLNYYKKQLPKLKRLYTNNGK